MAKPKWVDDDNLVDSSWTCLRALVAPTSTQIVIARVLWIKNRLPVFTFTCHQSPGSSSLPSTCTGWERSPLRLPFRHKVVDFRPPCCGLAVRKQSLTVLIREYLPPDLPPGTILTLLYRLVEPGMLPSSHVHQVVGGVCLSLSPSLSSAVTHTDT